MTLSRFFKFSVFALMALSFVACENDDDDDDTPSAVNDEELITDLRLTFTNTFDQSDTTFIFSDFDGPGGIDPVVDDIVLTDSTVYEVKIEVLDASNPNDVEDITEEIEEEDEEHQFFFIPSSAAESALTIVYDPTDLDENGDPVGLRSTWTTLGTTISGTTVRVVLRHELDKGASGVSDGDITNAGGETDIDATFNITITE